MGCRVGQIGAQQDVQRRVRPFLASLRKPGQQALRDRSEGVGEDGDRQQIGSRDSGRDLVALPDGVGLVAGDNVIVPPFGVLGADDRVAARGAQRGHELGGLIHQDQTIAGSGEQIGHESAADPPRAEDNNSGLLGVHAGNIASKKASSAAAVHARPSASLA